MPAAISQASQAALLVKIPCTRSLDLGSRTVETLMLLGRRCSPDLVFSVYFAREEDLRAGGYAEMIPLLACFGENCTVLCFK